MADATFRVGFATFNPSAAKLDAINIVRSAAGEKPVAALDTGGPSAAGRIEGIIDRHDERIQAMGWYFNRKHRIDLSPDELTSLVAVPASVLKIDASGKDAWRDIVPREGYLYDITNNTDVFSTAITTDYVEQVSFDAIPFEFVRWIAFEAAVEYVLHWNRDKKLVQVVESQRKQAMKEARHIHNMSSNANIRDSVHHRKVLGHYPRIYND